MRLRQVFATGAFALVEIRHGVQPQSVHTQVHPEIQHPEHLLMDRRMVEVQIRLVKKKTVPVVGIRHRVTSPVRRFAVFENDAVPLYFSAVSLQT